MIRIHKTDTVYTQLNSVSRSGMSRRIRAYIIRKNRPIDISGQIAQKLNRTINEKGILVAGCGMDMGFELVYSYSYALWPKGYTCTGENKCHSNDHFNGDRDYSKTNKHDNGGYCLNQEWL